KNVYFHLSNCKFCFCIFFLEQLLIYYCYKFLQMKYYATLLMVLLFAQFSEAQNTDYEKLWKQVEVFEMDDLPKSALKVVEQIEVLAIREQNKAQQIKTLLFKSKFALILEEDAQLKIINDFKAAISKNE